MAYADKGRTQEAIAEYRRAISISDYYPQVHYNLANSLFSSGNESDAINEYNRAIAMSPGFSYSYINLLNIYITKKDQKNIEITLKRMEIGIGQNRDFYYYAGVAYYGLKMYDKTIDSFRQALIYEPDNVDLKILIDRVKAEKENK